MTKEDLKFKRKLLGLSCAQLGEMVGVTRQQISNLETGRTPITKPMDITLKVVLGNRFYEISEDELKNNLFK